MELERSLRRVNAPESRYFVPGHQECVIAVWHERQCVFISRLRGDERAVIGRGSELGGVRLNARDHRITLPATRPYMSHNHLVVHNRADDARLHVFDKVLNPGWCRQWGDLNWRAVVPGARLDPRDGLLAFQLPDQSDWVLTIDWAPRTASSSSPRVDRVTELESTLRAVDVSPAQQDAIVAPLIDAVQWPPPIGTGSVRRWSDLSDGDALRAAYNRLRQAVREHPGMRWTDSGQRGADPALLTLLVETGSLDYGAVQRRRPWRPDEPAGLIHTHLC